jgi:hypothetical protein
MFRLNEIELSQNICVLCDSTVTSENGNFCYRFQACVLFASDEVALFQNRNHTKPRHDAHICRPFNHHLHHHYMCLLLGD